jgi:hypothetical protein
MEGVTTAIVAFLLLCVVFPTLVKNKPQYYAAFAAIILVILLSGLEAVVGSSAFHALATFFIAVLLSCALVLLVLSAGGLTWKQLAGEVTEAIDAVRRGETSGPSRPPQSAPPSGAQSAPVGATPASPKPPAAPGPTVRIDDSDSSIPLE